MTAYLIALVAVFFWVKMNASANAAIRLAGHLVMLAVILQITLGILTLIYVVPVPLATAHQGGAVILLTAMLYALRRIWKS
jgi:cytochrome c oxidase assembly protein subunit 15